MSGTTISGNSTKTFTTTASTKGILILLSNNLAANAMFIINTTSSGLVQVMDIVKGSAITTDVSESFKLKVSNSVSTATYAYAFIFDGNGISV